MNLLQSKEDRDPWLDDDDPRRPLTDAANLGCLAGVGKVAKDGRELDSGRLLFGACDPCKNLASGPEGSQSMGSESCLGTAKVDVGVVVAVVMEDEAGVVVVRVRSWVSFSWPVVILRLLELTVAELFPAHHVANVPKEDRLASPLSATWSILLVDFDFTPEASFLFGVDGDNAINSG